MPVPVPVPLLWGFNFCSSSAAEAHVGPSLRSLRAASGSTPEGGGLSLLLCRERLHFLQIYIIITCQKVLLDVYHRRAMYSAVPAGGARVKRGIIEERSSEREAGQGLGLIGTLERARERWVKLCRLEIGRITQQEGATAQGRKDRRGICRRCDSRHG